MSDSPKVDWELVERLYSAGQLSLRQIAAQGGVTLGALQRRIKKEGWTRDLTQKVQEQVRKALTTASVSDTGDAIQTGDTPAIHGSRARDPRTEREIVQQAAANAVEVVRRHQVSLHKAGELFTRLFTQLDEATAHRDEIEEAICEEMDPQIQAATGAERAALYAKKARMLRAVSLPGHAATYRDLAAAAKNFVDIERRTWGLEQGDRKPEEPFEGLTLEELERRRTAVEAEMAALNGRRG